MIINLRPTEESRTVDLQLARIKKKYIKKKKKKKKKKKMSGIAKKNINQKKKI